MEKIVYDDGTLPSEKAKEAENAPVFSGSVFETSRRRGGSDPAEITEKQTDDIVESALRLQPGPTRDNFILSRICDYIPTVYAAGQLAPIMGNAGFSVIPGMPAIVYSMMPEHFDKTAYTAAPTKSLALLLDKEACDRLGVSAADAMKSVSVMTRPEFSAFMSSSDEALRGYAFSKAPYGAITEEMILKMAGSITLDAVRNPNITVRWTQSFAKRFAEEAGKDLRPEMALWAVSHMMDGKAAMGILGNVYKNKMPNYTGTMDGVMKDIIVRYDGKDLEDIMSFASAKAPNAFTKKTIVNLITLDPQPSEGLLMSIISQMKVAGLEEEVHRYALKHQMSALIMETAI
jgi:hypothetical protein